MHNFFTIEIEKLCCVCKIHLKIMRKMYDCYIHYSFMWIYLNAKGLLEQKNFLFEKNLISEEKNPTWKCSKLEFINIFKKNISLLQISIAWKRSFFAIFRQIEAAEYSLNRENLRIWGILTKKNMTIKNWWNWLSACFMDWNLASWRHNGSVWKSGTLSWKLQKRTLSKSLKSFKIIEIKSMSKGTGSLCFVENFSIVSENGFVNINGTASWINEKKTVNVFRDKSIWIHWNAFGSQITNRYVWFCNW